MPPLCIRDARIQRPLREADRQCGDPDAPAVKDGEGLPESGAGAPQEVFAGESDIVEQEGCSVARTHPELVLLLADREPPESPWDDKSGDPFLPLPRTRDGHDNIRPADGALRDERLAPVQDPPVPFRPRSGSHPAGVAPGARLRQSPRTELPPRCEVRDVLLLLGVIAEEHDVPRAEAVV